MKARLLFKRRLVPSPDAFADVVLWPVPSPVRGSAHSLKYSPALVVDEVCVLRYDNEAGKGDHIHEHSEQRPYAFVSQTRLLNDFLGGRKVAP
ncbi:toxin-antitoxin system TumE family protein [Rhodopila globiformis]|uniref:Uncharacterized protein n=1 Tax=Rhodopila globiformis TaxID=1071 RepID=A0A2S6N9P7_RHOGL|nr:DUF6516 family protein [Rhodopila globiformis]PPQ31329.1 hypothetical protein CCS01_17530 [Rhodopila globiformis]